MFFPVRLGLRSDHWSWIGIHDGHEWILERRVAIHIISIMYNEFVSSIIII